MYKDQLESYIEIFFYFSFVYPCGKGFVHIFDCFQSIACSHAATFRL